MIAALRHPSSWLRTAGITLVIGILVIYCLGPFYWVLNVSLAPEEGFFMHNRAVYWPATPTLENYAVLLELTNFLTHMRNSAIVATSTMLLTIVVSILAAYSFARYRFPGRRMMISGLLLIYMVPSVVLVVPLLIIFKNLQLLNTFGALILAESTGTVPFAVWLLTNYFAALPSELEEAAMVDGCTPVGALVRVVLPLSVPGVIAAGLFVFIVGWNNFIFAFLLANTDATKTLPVFLKTFIGGESGIPWGTVMAGTMMATLPVALLFLFFQRYLIGGLAAGSVKG